MVRRCEGVATSCLCMDHMRLASLDSFAGLQRPVRGAGFPEDDAERSMSGPHGSRAAEECPYGRSRFQEGGLLVAALRQGHPEAGTKSRGKGMRVAVRDTW